MQKLFTPYGSGRSVTWYWRIWWWIGYHGPYQLSWIWERRFGNQRYFASAFLGALTVIAAILYEAIRLATQ